MMHCTSTTMASTAPVSTASSWWRKLPAGGMPKRMRISLAVQQMPARLMPSAPLALASAMSSGSRQAATIIADRVGSWPWTTMLTWSALRTPRLTSLVSGEGVPKRMSEMSVESMAPPQPSASEQRRAAFKMFSASRSTPSWVRCITSVTSRSMARGVRPSFCHSAWRLGVARRVVTISPNGWPNCARATSPTSRATSFVERPAVWMPR